MDIFSIREIIHQNKEDLWVKIGHYDYFIYNPTFSFSKHILDIYFFLWNLLVNDISFYKIGIIFAL